MKRILKITKNHIFQKILFLLFGIGIINHTIANRMVKTQDTPLRFTQIETAIPAFIGYTEKAMVKGTDYHAEKIIKPVKIHSLQEYELLFGRGSNSDEMEVELNANQSVRKIDVKAAYLLYNSIRLFYANGGEECFIVPVGKYKDSNPKVKKEDLLLGLHQLDNFEAPTLLVIPETVLLGHAQSGEVHAAMLRQCYQHKNRFAILDIVNGDLEMNAPFDPISKFRTNLGMNYLMYGAAYYPWLKTTLSHSGSYHLLLKSTDIKNGKKMATSQKISRAQLTASIDDIANDINKASHVSVKPKNSSRDKNKMNAVERKQKTPAEFYKLPSPHAKDSKEIYARYRRKIASPKTANSTSDREELTKEYIAQLKALHQTKMNILKDIKAIEEQGVVLPPSGAIAAIYARVDKERGVWKSPANTSISAVRGPAVKVTARGQEMLNIDNNSGKSVNPIIAFPGKGTLVWGARTLAGNDNEWRYIATRRFCNWAEASLKKEIAKFSSSPNNQSTWVALRTMAENFLTQQWQAGALAGNKPGHAFYVRAGVGQTMTAEDVLQGKMILEIGLAVHRPAEFIVLKISQEMPKP